MFKKIIGCLLGGAIGDALGMPVVGMSRSEINGMGGVQTFLASKGVSVISIPLNVIADSEAGDLLEAGQWTDDTQLSLALAETILEESGRFIPEAWAHKLVHWLNNEPRSPGVSSLQAAMQLRTGGVFWDESADPEGAGCGAATRSAPIALFFRNSPELRREFVLQQAQTTHGHPDAHAAALSVCEAIACVLPIRTDFETNLSGIGLLERLAEATASISLPYSECLLLARNLLEDEVEAGDAVRAIGTSSWSREAVPAALYLIARHLDECKAEKAGFTSIEHGVGKSSVDAFESLLLRSVNLTGDATESIATIVGSVAGALHGIDAIPALWQEKAEGADRIRDLAERLDKHSN